MWATDENRPNRREGVEDGWRDRVRPVTEDDQLAEWTQLVTESYDCRRESRGPMMLIVKISMDSPTKRY